MIAGVVLAGGRSTRMGTPKAWLCINGETLLARTVRVLAAATDAVVVSAAAGQSLPTTVTPFAVDDESSLGPLGGIVTVLRCVGNVETIFVAACDLPRLGVESVRTILAALADADAAVPLVEGRRQPLAAAYKTAILPVVERQILEGDRSLHGLLAKLRVQEVHGLDPEEFVNVNTHADYLKLIE